MFTHVVVGRGSSPSFGDGRRRRAFVGRRRAFVGSWRAFIGRRRAFVGRRKEEKEAWRTSHSSNMH